MQPDPGEILEQRLRVEAERRKDYYRLGDVGTNRVVAMRVSMGAFTPDGAAARCIQARAETTGETTACSCWTARSIERAAARSQAERGTDAQESFDAHR